MVIEFVASQTTNSSDSNPAATSSQESDDWEVGIGPLCPCIQPTSALTLNALLDGADVAETSEIVYACQSETEAHLVRATLTREGIVSTVSARSVMMIPGDGIFSTKPQFKIRVSWADAMRALEIIREAHAPQGVDWECPECGESNPANFEVCWRCQAQR